MYDGVNIYVLTDHGAKSTGYDEPWLTHYSAKCNMGEEKDEEIADRLTKCSLLNTCKSNADCDLWSSCGTTTADSKFQKCILSMYCDKTMQYKDADG